MTGGFTKNGTLNTTFHKPVWKANIYSRFRYGLKTIFYHTWGKVSGPMNADTVNAKYTDQESTKEVLGDELEGYFR